MSIKCKLFKSQNLDIGHFDVEFHIDGKVLFKETIKMELAECLPHIKFYRMSFFLVEFFVEKGILSRQQDIDYVHKIKALVETGNNLAVGTFEDDIEISEAIEKNGFHKALNCVCTKQRFRDLKFAIPSTPSGLKKS